jgi:hypothetical protein
VANIFGSDWTHVDILASHASSECRRRATTSQTASALASDTNLITSSHQEGCMAGSNPLLDTHDLVDTHTSHTLTMNSSCLSTPSPRSTNPQSRRDEDHHSTKDNTQPTHPNSINQRYNHRRGARTSEPVNHTHDSPRRSRPGDIQIHNEHPEGAEHTRTSVPTEKQQDQRAY